MQLNGYTIPAAYIIGLLGVGVWGLLLEGLAQANDERSRVNLAVAVEASNRGLALGPGSGAADTVVGWIQAGVFGASTGHISPAWESYTATQIADISHAVNTTGKYAGKFVWDTTNKRLMRAISSGASGAWEVVDGSAQVTPS